MPQGRPGRHRRGRPRPARRRGQVQPRPVDRIGPVPLEADPRRLPPDAHRHLFRPDQDRHRPRRDRRQHHPHRRRGEEGSHQEGRHRGTQDARQIADAGRTGKGIDLAGLRRRDRVSGIVEGETTGEEVI